MTRACFRCSDSGVGNKKSVFLLISLCTVQPIIARYHEIRCSPPIIAPYLHIRISNLPYPSYPYIQLAISFMSSYVSYPYIRNAISLIFSYPYITGSHSLLSWYPRVEQLMERSTEWSRNLMARWWLIVAIVFWFCSIYTAAVSINWVQYVWRLLRTLQTFSHVDILIEFSRVFYFYILFMIGLPLFVTVSMNLAQ